MSFTLPALPYAKNALEPHISAETLDYHYGKHHQTYVDKLNGMIEGTEHAGKSLEEIVRKSSGGLFNNAAQVWNHSFYWQCLSPTGGGEPKGALAEAIKHRFVTFDEFRKQFSATAVGTFGSGWGWLVKNADGSLDLLALSPLPLEAVVALKACAHWIATGLPLIAAAPVLAITLNLPGPAFWPLMAALAAGTPGLSLIGAVGAALTVGVRRGGLLLSLLVLPLYLPALVLGARAVERAAVGLDPAPPLMLLGAVTLLSAALGPFAAAAALRVNMR